MWVNLQTCKIWDKSLSSKDVPVILTSYHRPQTFVRCVKSVLQATHQPIYIIDNSEGQLKTELAWAQEAGCQVFENTSNIGKPASIVKYWDSIPQNQWFITMDPDMIVPEGGIDQLISSANELSEAGFQIGIMCPAYEQKGRTWARQLEKQNLAMHNWTEMSEFKRSIYANSTLAGCLMLVNTIFYNQLGGYPGTRLYNDDDGWLCNESHKAGLMNVLNANVICEHDLTEESPEYREWKDRNATEQIDPKGHWDH